MRLVDYECITAGGNVKGKRLIAFGAWAVVPPPRPSPIHLPPHGTRAQAQACAGRQASQRDQGRCLLTGCERRAGACAQEEVPCPCLVSAQARLYHAQTHAGACGHGRRPARTGGEVASSGLDFCHMIPRPCRALAPPDAWHLELTADTLPDALTYDVYDL